MCVLEVGIHACGQRLIEQEFKPADRGLKIEQIRVLEEGLLVGMGNKIR